MPGIHLYSSNRLETLADLFAELLHSQPLPPLQKEIILMQSRGMARWLAMETASRLNIWANCDCPFPNTFINNIFRLLLPDIPDASSYARENILWHLMAILPESAPEDLFRKVASYIGSGDDLKLYQLAYETADLFDQYTLFRPRMILDWEDNIYNLPGDNTWQAIVWNRLVERLRQKRPLSDYHRARLLQLFEKRVQEPSFDKALLPQRVSVFGISSLPPYHLRVLAALSHHIELHLFVMNPCREYWFDIIADRDIVKISRNAAAGQETLHLTQGNSLLASMGHLGRDFMAMLQELYTADREIFLDPGNHTLLANIQQDILYLQENPGRPPGSNPARKVITGNDASLVFHSCHSPMREVEILHDLLLELFDKAGPDEPVEPRDILVMAPDIDEYAPLIRAVFDADATTHKKIPYSISDQSILQTSKYIETFLDLLRLAHSRYSSSDVMGILEAEPVRNRFGINENDLTVIEKWIGATRICWGVDQDHKASLHLPPHRENTWRAGLDRLLLGYAMPGNDRVLFAHTLPYDHIEGNDAQLLGNFLDFSETLFTLAETLQQPHTLADWSDILLQTKTRLLRPDAKTEPEDRELHRLLHGLKELQNRTLFTAEVSLGVIRSFLIHSLADRFSPIAGGHGFLAGGVTFCSMLPMRAIPFKFICLFGMNDGQYPRAGRRKSFDIMAMEPKRGDRSKRYDDRYLFLETILSVRKKLSISFVGQSIQDGSKRPPSVLVSELMDYIDQGYTREDTGDGLTVPLSDVLTTVHHLQPFHPDYFKSPGATDQGGFFSYSAENFAAARALASEQQSIAPGFSAPLPPPPDTFKRVALHDLARFFSHPVRYLLVKIIGIAPIEENRALETSEPFILEGLERYNLEQDILACLLENRDCSELYQIKKAAGVLPPGDIGKTFFAQMVSELQTFHNTLARLFPLQELKGLQVNLEIGAYTLSGRLDNVYAEGLVQYRYGTIKPQDVIRSWISHLALNSLRDSAAADKGMYTVFAGRDGIYKYAPAPESISHLKQLLDIYWLGLTEPLHFFPRTSFTYALQLHNGRNDREAMRRASIEWEGNGFDMKGEKNDPYNLLCCKDLDITNPLFKEQAKKVFLAAFAHREKYG